MTSTVDRKFSSKPDPTKPGQIQSRGVLGGDNRIIVANPTAAPFAPVGRISARWKGADGQLYTADDKISISSGALISNYHVLTAAHCFYDKNRGGFADVIDFIPGSSGRAINARSTRDTSPSDKEHYGRAKVTYMRSFSSYSNDSNWLFDNARPVGEKWRPRSFDYDMGVLTLDRNIGTLTGHFGYGHDPGFREGTIVNATGYPGDRLYDMINQSGKITKVTAERLQSNDLDYIRGNSGGPVWLANRIIYGVVSTESPTINSATRITASKFKAIKAWIEQDRTSRSPVDKPDLIDYATWFNQGVGGFIVNGVGSASTATAGQSFHANLWVRNTGTVTASNFSVSFYLSSDNDVTNSTGFHYLLGTASGLSVAPANHTFAGINSTVPNVPVGTYYVVAFLDPTASISEYDDSIDSNQKVYGSLLTIQPSTRATVKAANAVKDTGNSIDRSTATNLLRGRSSNDTLTGTSRNETLIGGAGADELNGYGTTSSNRSQFDRLTGGAGADTFVLGGDWGVSYVETGNGCAIIQDWQGTDQIQLKGSASYYRLGVKGSDTEIYYSTRGITDRIAIIRDTTALNLNRDFSFV